MAKKQTFVTPKGTAKFPWLSKPDTRFNPAGVYSVILLLETGSEECDKLTEMIGTFYEEKRDEAQALTPKKKLKLNDPPYREDLDENDEPTGYTRFKFKMNASFEDKQGNKVEMKPLLFDSKGKEIKKEIAIYGGSTIKVAFSMVPYNTKGFGIVLYIQGVQIIELVTSSRSAESMGFGVEEEGFTCGDDDGEDTPFDSSADDSNDDASDY